jgi:hypothetical protein
MSVRLVKGDPVKGFLLQNFSLGQQENVTYIREKIGARKRNDGEKTAGKE